MGETILSWNVANWITVSLMVLVLFFLLAIAQKFVTGQRARGGTRPSSNALSPSVIS